MSDDRSSAPGEEATRPPVAARRAATGAVAPEPCGCVVDATDVVCAHLDAWARAQAAADVAEEERALLAWRRDATAAPRPDDDPEVIDILDLLPPADWDTPLPADPTGSPELISALPGGAQLAGALERAQVDDLDPYDAVEFVAAFKRVESWAAGRAALAAAALAHQPAMSAHGLPGHPADLTVNGTAEEISMRLGTTRHEAATVVKVGHGLRTSFGDTADALTSGEIDWRKATTIVNTLWGLPEAVVWSVQQEVLPDAPTHNVTQLARDLAKALIAADHHDATQRHKRALRRQHVTRPRPLPDGMAALTLVTGAEDAVPFDLLLDNAAKELRSRGDGRTLGELRAEALLLLGAGALQTGWLGPRPDAPQGSASLTTPPQPATGPRTRCTAQPDGALRVRCSEPADSADPDRCPQSGASSTEPGNSPGGDAVPAKPDLPPLHALCRPRRGIVLTGDRQRIDVRITVPLSVLLPGREPDSTSLTFGGTTAADHDPPPDWPDLEPPPTAQVAILGGYGPVTPDVAQALAAGGTWKRIVTDPLSGAVLDVGCTRYRPPAALADHVRQRDTTCFRPSCSAPASRCELDHTVPAAHGGPTAHHNLGPACTRDHQLKTSGLFRVRQPSPGVFEWTTPAGHRYRRTLDGTIERVARPALPPPSADDPF